MVPAYAVSGRLSLMCALRYRIGVDRSVDLTASDPPVDGSVTEPVHPEAESVSMVFLSSVSENSRCFRGRYELNKRTEHRKKEDIIRKYNR